MFYQNRAERQAVSHVALVGTAEELRTIIPFLREAFDLAVSEVITSQDS